MTISQLIQKNLLSPDAMRMRWGRCGNSDFEQSREITTEELERYNAKYPPVAALKTMSRLSATNVTTSTSTVKQVAKQNEWMANIKQVGIYDLLMWADLVLGTYSLFILFGPLAGLLVGTKISLFFEQARRTMRRKPRNIEQYEYNSNNYVQAQIHNDRLTRTKNFQLAIAILLCGVFCWANGQNFYRAILANTPDLAQGVLADYAARTFALLVTTIALSSMYSLRLQANITEHKNGK